MITAALFIRAKKIEITMWYYPYIEILFGNKIRCGEGESGRGIHVNPWLIHVNV